MTPPSLHRAPPHPVSGVPAPGPGRVHPRPGGWHALAEPVTRILAGLVLWTLAASAAPETNRFERLTLEQAIALAERHAPEAAEARALAEAGAGRAAQAGRWPNPELVGRVEALPLGGGSTDRSEILGGVAQQIPLGNRLARARDVGQLEHERSLSQIDVRRRALERRVRSAFATALFQEAAMQLRGEMLSTAEQGAALAAVRVREGDSVPAEAARMGLEVARMRLELRRSEALRDQAAAELAGAIGIPALAIVSLKGELEVAFEVPELEALVDAVAGNPGVLAARADVAAREARVALARAERIPDVRVEALYRRQEGEGGNAIDLGFSIPLPLFDRGRGSVRAARAEWEAAEARSRAAVLELEQAVREAHRGLAGALERARLLREEVLPRLDTLRRSAEARHAAGDTSLGEVLPVRRDGSVARLDYLEAVRDAMRAWADLKAAAGLR